MQSLYRPAAGAPDGALVLLHGRGADEHDLFPLLDILDPERRLLGATARGPLSLPPGGAHWYVVRRVGYPDPDTFHATYPELTGWLDGMLAEHGISPDRLVLGGFSQGSVMSYALGLGADRPRPAGIMALSGFLPQVEGFELDLAKADGLPVAIGHGLRGVRARRARPPHRGGRRPDLPRVADAAHDRSRLPPRAARLAARGALVRSG
jgi:phospholipase/carboxylesterase